MGMYGIASLTVSLGELLSLLCSSLFVTNILQCITHNLYILHNILYALLDYSSYNKRDLLSKGLDQYVSVLSEVVYKRWDELNDDAKQAATQLCFFQQTWDEETLGTW